MGIKFWALVVVVVMSLFWSRRSLDFTHLVLMALTLWQALSHFRHVPFFALLCGFWIGPHLQSMLLRIQKSPSPKLQWTKTVVGRAAMATAIAVLLGFIGWRLADRLSQLRVDRQTYPVDAFEFMHDHDLRGRLVVSFDWAQYALAAFCVDRNLLEGQQPSRLAHDGRFRTCYPQQIIDMHFDFVLGNGPGVRRHRSPISPPCDPGRILEFGHPDLVVLRRVGELSELHMQPYTDKWALLYQDNVAQIWGRRTKYDDPLSSDYLPPEKRKLDARVSGYVDWPALVHKSKPQTIAGDSKIARNGN
jgi:hypothetical protein